MQVARDVLKTGLAVTRLAIYQARTLARLPASRGSEESRFPSSL